MTTATYQIPKELAARARDLATALEKPVTLAEITDLGIVADALAYDIIRCGPDVMEPPKQH